MAKGDEPAQKWHEIIKLKEIIFAGMTVSASVTAAWQWVDGRYAKNRDVLVSQAQVQQQIISLECRLLTSLTELGASELLGVRQSELRGIREKLIKTSQKSALTLKEAIEQKEMVAKEASVQREVDILTYGDTEGDCK